MSSFWLLLKQQWTIKISSPLFSIFSLAAILVGSRDHRTQFWKGAIQGPFHQSLVQIGPVVSEELIKMWKVNGRTDAQWWQWAKNYLLKNWYNGCSIWKSYFEEIIKQEVIFCNWGNNSVMFDYLIAYLNWLFNGKIN